MESSRSCGGIDRKLLAKAFGTVHKGYSADRVVSDPALNVVFLHACVEIGISATASELNTALLNLRKVGGWLPTTTKRTSFDDDNYRFASEIAIRILERRHAITLDGVLCDPSIAAEFDELANSISPGYSPFEYRWAALKLRKKRSLLPEISARLLRPESVQLAKLDELDLQMIPRQPGVYAFIDSQSKQTLYIGEASDLRHRLATHSDHSDNKLLARHLWQHGRSLVHVEYYVLPAETSKRELRAFEAEQIQSRRPLFNICGRA